MDRALGGWQPDRVSCLCALMLSGWWDMDVEVTAVQVWEGS